MFEAYITNAALYPEAGVEVGTTLKFPATTQEVQAALAKIGIDGKQYTEVFFTSFDSDDVLGLYDYLYEYAGIDEFNELAHTLLGVRDKGELEKYEAALVLGKHTESVKDLMFPNILISTWKRRHKGSALLTAVTTSFSESLMAGISSSPMRTARKLKCTAVLLMSITPRSVKTPFISASLPSV